MVKKCCMVNCDTNYASKKDDGGRKISVFRFPSEKNEPEERKKWIGVCSKVRADLRVTDETVICELHWPENYPTYRKKGHERPSVPPSIFIGIPSSIVPDTLPPPQETLRSWNQLRNMLPDELDEFERLDRLSYSDLEEQLVNSNTRQFSTPTTAFLNDGHVYIQSMTYFQGVPTFLLLISETLKFEAFHIGVKVNVPSLSRNRVSCIDRWSILEQALHFLASRETTSKLEVLKQQVDSMSCKSVGESLYNPDIMTRAFEYFTTSRSLYHRLREDYQLPSVRTLTRVTSKVSKLQDGQFIKRVFDSLTEEKKHCLLLFDEVYVKKMMTLHGGTVFGKAANNPTLLANAVLGLMIDCLFGGPTFLSKMIPVTKMTRAFLSEQIDITLEAIISAGGTVQAMICDNNRTNQSLFNKIKTVDGKPWRTPNDMFLLFDYVHIMKNIRNNWLTEKTGELVYDDGGVKKTAKWSHITQLFKAEVGDPLLRMSKLTEKSVMPKHTEKQSVPLCLQVFCDETAVALLSHSATKNEEGIQETATFIQKVVKFWKIVSVKKKFMDIIQNDPLTGVIEDPDDPRLAYIKEFGDMCLKMESKPKLRMKQLTRDTALAIHQTCYGLVELAQKLLASTHVYVALGKFTTDPLEKAFGKLRQESGGQYFISAQQVLEKLNIQKAKLLLSLTEMEDLPNDTGHKCELCGFGANEEVCEIVDNLAKLEESLTIDTKQSLVHIAGYATRKDAEPSDTEMLSRTTFYSSKYGDYTDRLDRGQLNIPHDKACQWTFFCFIVFNTVKDRVCRNSMAALCDLVSEHYNFAMTPLHSRIISNIFLKNYCRESTPRNSQESKQKVIKLSVAQ